MNSSIIPRNPVYDKPKTDTRLVKRGIASQADAMQWICAQNRWEYPVFNFDGNIVTRRGKAYPNATTKQKYIFIPSKLNALYYHAPGIRQAVNDSDGLLYIANGEPSVLAYHASGIFNVLSWFGEGSIPSSFIADMTELGVNHIVYAPDNDTAGLKSAITLRNLLHDTDIQLTILDISAHVDHKGDTNDLWIAVNFDSQRYLETLNACPALVLPAYEQPRTHDYSDNADNRDDLIEQVAKALGVWGQAQNADGWTRKNISSPFRDDKNASCGFNFNTGVLNDFGGQSHSVYELAEHFGIEYKRTASATRQADDLNAIPDSDDTQETSRTCRHCGQSIDDLHHAKRYCNDDCKKAFKARQKAKNNPIRFDDSLQPVKLARATHTVNLPYVSDIDPQIVVDAVTCGVLSPTGTGKTAMISRYIDCSGQWLDKPIRALVVTHRKALSRNIATTLNFDCYSDLSDSELIASDKLVICLNSLHRLAVDGKLPHYDVLILDEPQHLLNHLLTDTFKNNEAVIAYQYLKHYIKSSQRLLLLDAHLSQTVIDIIGKIRPQPMTVIENSYRKERGTVNLYLDEAKALDEAIVSAGNNHKLVVACETVTQSKSTYSYLCARYGDDNVLIINADTSSNPDVSAFLANPDSGLSQYRAIVHTSTIDSGVSFDTTKAVVCGLFNGSVPHVASDINQMIARVRNPIALHLFVANVDRATRPVNALDIYNAYEAKALRNNALIDIVTDDASGISKVEITAQYKQLLNVLSRLDRDRNIQANNLIAYVVAYLKFDGFTVQLQHGKSTVVSEALKDNRDDHKQHMKDLRLSEDTQRISADEYDALRDDETYTITDEDIAGRTKDAVLSAVGDIEYSEQLDKDLLSQRNRQKLYNLTDLYTDVKYLAQADTEDRDLLHKRKYRTLSRHVYKAFIQAIFNVDDLSDAIGIVLSSGELESRLRLFVSDNRDDLKLIGIDIDRYKTASRLARAIFDKFAVKLDGKQVRQSADSFEYFYQIDVDYLNRWLGYKDSRQDVIHKREQKQYAIFSDTA